MNARTLPEVDHKSNGNARKGRISSRVRTAITLKVEKALTGEQAAALAGLSNSGFWKAWGQPHVQQLYRELKAQYIQRAMDRKEVLRAHAIDIAAELMKEGNPPNIRAKMVELFTSEPRPGASVAVQVNVDRGGYEFVRPGARMVEINPITDAPSGGDDSQATEE